MLASVAGPANPFAFPVAAVALSPQARLDLLPARLGRAWLLAGQLDRAVARLDLRRLASCYHRRGSLPWPPQLMLVLALFGIADGKSSPAQWAELANRDGPTRWLVWGIEPSVSACYDFRDRLGEDALEQFNTQVLTLAQHDHLSPCHAGAVDGSLIAANASRHHLHTASRLAVGLLLLESTGLESNPDAAPPTPASDSADQPVTAPLEDASTQPLAGSGSTTEPSTPSPEQRPRRPVRPAPTAPRRSQQHQRWRRAQQELQRRQQRNQQKRASKRTDPSKMVISPTDPEAAVGRDKRGVFRPLYNVQLVADLDSDLILGYGAFAQQNDSGLLGRMLEKTERLVGHRLTEALVDGAYVGGADLAEAEAHGVRILGPLAQEAKTGQLPKSAFVYEPEQDRYVCPQGKTLARVGQSRQKRSSVELVVLTQYQNKDGECQVCVRKASCCPRNPKGRTISRSEHEESLERLKERMSQSENKKKYKRRAATVERLFGDGKGQRGLEGVRGRGLRTARIQLALTVLQHNLRVLARAMQTSSTQAATPTPKQRDT